MEDKETLQEEAIQGSHEDPQAPESEEVTVVNLEHGIDTELSPRAVQVELDFDQLMKLKEHRLEEKKHDFEVEKYVREQRGQVLNKGASQASKYLTQRTDLVFTALNVYRAGMGHDHKPHTVEIMLEEFKLVWNTIYGLCHPMGMVPDESMPERLVEDLNADPDPESPESSEG